MMPTMSQYMYHARFAIGIKVYKEEHISWVCQATVCTDIIMSYSIIESLS